MSIDDRTETTEGISPFLNQPVQLSSYGDRMVAFAQKMNLPLEKTTSREELIRKGFAMINQVGNGERVIVQECAGNNWRDKAILTTEELSKSKQETLPKGITEKELQSIAADMETFIDEVQKVTLLNGYLGRMGISQNANDMNSVARKFGVQDKIQKAGLFDWSKKAEIIKQAQDDVRSQNSIPRQVRGISVDKLERRGESKVGKEECPVLNCSHKFENPGGVLIYDQDGELAGEPATLRINSVVAHLASHGISETGVSNPDQRYITISEYLPIYERRGQPTVPEGIDEKQIGLQVFVESANRFLRKAGVNHISKEELTKFGKEEIFFIKDWPHAPLPSPRSLVHKSTGGSQIPRRSGR